MQSIQEILQSNNKEKGSERNSVLKEIYDLYFNDRLSRKLENWKRYCNYLRNNKIQNSPVEVIKFQKSKLYIKELPPKTIAIKLSHIPTKDLYYLLSICKDKKNRKESIGAFILGSIKA